MNHHIKRMKWLPAVFFAVVLTACEDEDGQVVDRDWQLVWEDNFDGDVGTAIDTTKWTYDIGRGMDGWGNQELQYYTDRTDNVLLDGNGNLAIVSRRETFGGAAFTSARINTKNIFAQRYGRIEARIQIPYGPGLWPAFWMLGQDIDAVSWPQCGEIDIMEARGQEPSVIHGSVHGPGYSGGNPITDSYTLPNGRFDTDFYVYAVEWTENQIDFFVDDILYQRITPDDVPGEWVYDDPFFIILNVAVGGNYVGPPADQTTFPQTMLVDYVRVYQEAE